MDNFDEFDDEIDEFFEDDNFHELCGYSIGLGEGFIPNENPDKEDEVLPIIRVDLEDDEENFHVFGISEDMAKDFYEHLTMIMREAGWLK
jgi:hypothetical protein